MVLRRIASLHKELKGGPDAFYWGLRRLPRVAQPPSGRAAASSQDIGQILKDLGLSEPNTRKVRKGASQYLCYPEHTIYKTLRTSHGS